MAGQIRGVTATATGSGLALTGTGRLDVVKGDPATCQGAVDALVRLAWSLYKLLERLIEWRPTH